MCKNLQVGNKRCWELTICNDLTMKVLVMTNKSNDNNIKSDAHSHMTFTFSMYNTSCIPTILTAASFFLVRMRSKYYERTLGDTLH
jgi:hypothetical protein